MNDLEIKFKIGELVRVYPHSACREGIITQIFPNLGACDIVRTEGVSDDLQSWEENRIFTVKMSIITKVKMVEGVKK